MAARGLFQRQKQEETPKNMPGDGWVPRLRKKHYTVFAVGTISDGLDAMTGAVEEAKYGHEDARTAYLRLASESEADLKSVGGVAFVDEDERRQEAIGETGVQDEGDDPRSRLLIPSEPSAPPHPGSEQYLLENMKDMSIEEASLEAQRQAEQEIVTARSRLSWSSDGKKSMTDDPQLGVRKRDRVSKRAMPPKKLRDAQDPSQAEEGKEGDSLGSTHGDLSELQGEDLDTMASLSKMSKTSEKDIVTFGKIRHFQVHRKSDKMDVDETGKEPELGGIILRLIPSSRGNVITGLDEGVRQMSLGETADIKVRFDHAYNSFGMTESIPARANMIFTVKLQAINGFGLAGLPLRVSKRIYRFTTVFCRKTSDLIRFIAQDAKKKKRMRRLCSWMYSLYKRDNVEEDEVEEVVEYIEEKAEFSDEEQDQAVVIKADKRMKNHLTPSVLAGAKYFWAYTPKVKVKKSKRKDKHKAVSDSEDSEEDEDFDGLEDIEEGEWEEYEAGTSPGGVPARDEEEEAQVEGGSDVELNPVEASPKHESEAQVHEVASRSESGSVDNGGAPAGSAYSKEKTCKTDLPGPVRGHPPPSDVLKYCLFDFKV